MARNGDTTLQNLPVDIVNSIDPATGRLVFQASGGAATGATLNTGQVSVAQAAIQLVAANANRKDVTFKNTGANPIWIGQTSGVTTGNGHQLGSGGTLTLSNYSGAVFANSTTGTNVVTFVEEAA